jgi:hypothetical protein
MGLAVFNGQLYPIWSGNFNGPFGDPYNNFLKNGAVTGFALNVWYRPMVIAAGPRVVTSSMGPIPLAEAAGGTVSISVTFDRPVDPASVKPGDVQVFYHDAVKTSDPSIPLQVTGVTTAPTIFTGTLTFGSKLVTGVSSTTGLFFRETITGVGIPPGSTIQSIDSVAGTITLSSAATISGTQNLAGVGSSTLGYTQYTITFNPARSPMARRAASPISPGPTAT